MSAISRPNKQQFRTELADLFKKMFHSSSVKHVDGASCGFEWSFKPFITWMRLLTGIRIDFNANSTKKWTLGWIGSVFHGVLVLLVNATSVYLAITIMFNMMIATNLSATENGTQPPFNGTKLMILSGTGKLSLMIEVFNSVFILIGVHAWFFAVSLTSRWERLWVIWKEIQRIDLPFTTYRKIRWKAYVLVGIVIMVCLFYYTISYTLPLT